MCTVVGAMWNLDFVMYNVEWEIWTVEYVMCTLECQKGSAVFVIFSS